MEPQSSLHDTLWRTLTKTGPTQLDIMNIMLGVLEGLMIMHAAGLAHLDLKPGNVILTDAATAKLADFGAACAIDLRTGKLAVGLGPSRGMQVDSLVESMEQKLGVNIKMLGSAYAPGNGMADAVASAALGVVRASVLPVKSCPGEIDANEADDDGDQRSSLAGCRRLLSGRRLVAAQARKGGHCASTLVAGWTACPEQGGHQPLPSLRRIAGCLRTRCAMCRWCGHAGCNAIVATALRWLDSVAFVNASAQLRKPSRT